MRLAFMTWACPNWTIKQILDAALRYGYGGVEFRLSQQQAHGVEVDMSEERKLIVRRAFKDSGVQICCLASSSRFSSADPSERRRVVEQTKAEIELAADLDCPYLRVFGGAIPKGVSMDDAKSYIADCLRELGEFAKPHGVFVCLETHDAFSRAKDAAEVVALANHQHVGIVWDIRHPYAHGETMAEAFERVKPFVKHCHFGDQKRMDGRWEFALIGDGDIPIGDAVHLLRSIAFDGFLSLEAINAPMDADTLLREYAKRMSKLL